MKNGRGIKKVTFELDAHIRAKLALVADHYGASWEDAIYLAVHHEWNGIQMLLAECEAARQNVSAPLPDDDIPL